MLALRREMALPSVGRCMEMMDLWHPQLRMRVVRSSGIIHDDALLRSVPVAPERARVLVVLGGQARVRDGSRSVDLSCGELHVCALDDSWSMRSEGSEFSMLALDWRGDFAPPPVAVGDAPVQVRSLARLKAVAESLMVPPRHGGAPSAAVVAAWEELRSCGVVRDAIRPVVLEEPCRHRLARLAKALSTAGCDMADAPALIDIERSTHRTRRSVSRDFRDFASRYALPDHSWRETVDRWRLENAVCLATHKCATANEIAHGAGFGSPEALCHALNRHGLPAPRLIPRALDALP